MTKVLIVGHADADGHLIAEQVRRNLARIDSFKVDVVVDPERTKDHKAWTNLETIGEIEAADYVFFVDLMFAPASYAAEAKALTNFVQGYPKKRFFLIDHHPLPLRRLEVADNLRVIYRPDVSECTIGPRTGMMVVAALCERQIEEVADVKTSLHDALALGLRRAAALGGPLPGEKLLALLKADRWDALLQLGNEDPQSHQLPRGRRSGNEPQSKILRRLNKTAIELVAQDHKNAKSSNETERGTTIMAYDADVGHEQLSYNAGRRVLHKNAAPSPKDLGVIATLLEIAAISLTTAPGATFTFDQLVREARELGGQGLDLDERDISIVLKKASFIEKVGKEYRAR